jgi:hypothetical protein
MANNIAATEYCNHLADVERPDAQDLKSASCGA